VLRGSHIGRCHACGTEFLCGRRVTSVCTACRDAGHTDEYGNNCPACRREAIARERRITTDVTIDALQKARDAIVALRAGDGRDACWCGGRTCDPHCAQARDALTRIASALDRYLKEEAPS